MKTSPYLVFNGNCMKAIKLYEKAFKTKANYCQYKDTPPVSYTHLDVYKRQVFHRDLVTVEECKRHAR